MGGVKMYLGIDGMMPSKGSPMKIIWGGWWMGGYAVDGESRDEWALK